MDLFPTLPMNVCPWASTQTLLAAARIGDLFALDRILARHRIELADVVRASLGVKLSTRVEADDIFQEASMQAMRSIKSLRANDFDGFRRWFAGIARHRVLAHAEAGRERVQPRRTTPLPDAHLTFHDPQTMPDAQADAVAEPHDAERARSPVVTVLADGRLAMLLHGMFGSEWGKVAFVLDRPTREAARQLHLRTRIRLGV